MTQKEKDWIIKIQLMQLHTENPYLDDYYYTVSSSYLLQLVSFSHILRNFTNVYDHIASQTWNMNRLANEREKRKQVGQNATGKDDKELQLVIPQLAKLENKTYKPSKLFLS